MKQFSTIWALLLCGSTVYGATPPLAHQNLAVDSVLYQTDFTYGASGWTATVGAWAVVADSVTSGNYVYRNANATGDSWATFGLSSWTDYAVTVRIRPTSFSGVGLVRVFARYQNLTNWYYVNLRSSGTVELRKYVNGVASDLATPKAFPVSLGAWYTVRLEALGPSLKVFVNGVLQLSGTDTSFKAGPIAVGGYNATADFDDVLVGRLAPTLPPPPPVAVGPVANIFVSPLGFGIDSGGPPQYVGGHALDSTGVALGMPLTWTSSDTTVVTVRPFSDAITQVAIVFLRRPGLANVMAMAGGKTGTIAVTITSPPAPPPSVLLSVRGFRVENVPSRWQGVLPAQLPLYTTPAGTPRYVLTLFGVAYDTMTVAGHATCAVIP